MKITIHGKAGEGKTTLAALLSNVLSRLGYTVVVEDGYLTEEYDDKTGEPLFARIQDRENARMTSGTYETREVGIKVVQRKANPKPVLKDTAPPETVTKPQPETNKWGCIPSEDVCLAHDEPLIDMERCSEGKIEPLGQTELGGALDEDTFGPLDHKTLTEEEKKEIRDDTLAVEAGEIESVETEEAPKKDKKSCLPWKN